MAGNYSGALRAQYGYVNAKLGAPALFYLVLMANPDKVGSKYSSYLPETTTPPIMQLLGIYSATTLSDF